MNVKYVVKCLNYTHVPNVIKFMIDNQQKSNKRNINRYPPNYCFGRTILHKELTTFMKL